MPENLAVANLAGIVPPAEARLLARRHRQARWHSLIRHPTKPRLVGGDFSLWRSDYEAVNGFDERFVGWGQEDDDFGLRLRTAGVRLDSILDLTHSLHVWHPTDPTATPRWRDGANVGYFQRQGRLTACRVGLEHRGVESILWGLPTDIGATVLGRAVAAELAHARQVAAGRACEIEIAIHGGRSTFTRRAECRLLLVPEGSSPSRSMTHRADRVIAVDPNDPSRIRSTLESIG
jgi:hypothetical protein